MQISASRRFSAGVHSRPIGLWGWQCRNIRVRESVRIQLRAEFYNLLNHANLELAAWRGRGNEGIGLPNPSFAGGTIAGAVATYGGTPRQVVLAAKILF